MFKHGQIGDLNDRQVFYYIDSDTNQDYWFYMDTKIGVDPKLHDQIEVRCQTSAV